jgi:alginate production protein
MPQVLHVLAQGLRVGWWLWLLTVMAATWAEWAQSYASVTVEGRQDDGPPTRPTRWPPWLGLAGQLEVETTHDTHITLGTTPNDAQTLLHPELVIEASLEFTRRIQGFLELELSHDFVLTAASQGETDTDPAGLLLNEAFVQVERLFGSRWSLQIGRQSFDDPRQWLFDDELDAVRVLYQAGALQLDMAIARRGLVALNLLNSTTEERADYYWLYGQYNVGPERTLAAYSLLQTDHRADVALLFLGLRSQGELVSDLSYWFDLAHVRGKAEGRTVRAWGFDIGLLYPFDAPSEPTITLSVAFGSGDATPEEGLDTAFRQTGLHGNAAELASIVDYQYYGEFLDPELSNLLIVTTGIGLRPWPRTSLTLVYHHYQQLTAVDMLRDARITAEPTGRSRILGQALEGIGGWASGNFELKVVFGAFWPGPAFTGTDPVAFFALGRVRLAFD